MSNEVIWTENLTKVYSNGTVGISNVSLTVKRGEIYGLIGPNGAGKTTTVMILATLLLPTSGKATVLGYDVVQEADKIRKHIGLVQQRICLDIYASVYDNLDIYGVLLGLSKTERREKIRELLSVFGLESVKNVDVLRLSYGTRKRLQVAREFMRDVPLLFLDEPTAGLDPAMQRKVLDYIKNYAKEKNATILYTTHLMDEVVLLCKRIGFLYRGKLAYQGAVEDFMDKYGRVSRLEFLVEDEAKLSDALNELRGRLNGDRVKRRGKTVIVTTRDVFEELSACIDVFKKLGVRVRDVKIREGSLDDAYINLVKKLSE